MFLSIFCLSLVAKSDRKKRIVEKYGEISNWDTSKVTSMDWMFQGVTSFNQPFNDWNVSNVTNMSALFHNAFFAMRWKKSRKKST